MCWLATPTIMIELIYILYLAGSKQNEMNIANEFLFLSRWHRLLDDTLGRLETRPGADKQDNPTQPLAGNRWNVCDFSYIQYIDISSKKSYPINNFHSVIYSPTAQPYPSRNP